MIAQFRYFYEFPHKVKVLEETKIKKFAVRDRDMFLAVQLGWVTNLKITRKRQKDEHDQSSVKFPPKSALGFILVKENWKKRQSKMNQAKILLRCNWRPNR